MRLDQEIREWQKTTDMFTRMGLDRNPVAADFGSGYLKDIERRTIYNFRKQRREQ